ncbi:uncharacterized protein LOC143781389 [Ranitomeya variabilis]|uniref:uncharacterized protein LOC143781389 n=1 Tax=Ranitomeya variabilis TaxID=490064 RepID=UPI00405678C4
MTKPAGLLVKLCCSLESQIALKKKARKPLQKSISFRRPPQSTADAGFIIGTPYQKTSKAGHAHHICDIEPTWAPHHQRKLDTPGNHLSHVDFVVPCGPFEFLVFSAKMWTSSVQAYD